MTSIAVVVILVLLIALLAEFAERCGGPADGHDPVVSHNVLRDVDFSDSGNSGSLPSGGPKQRRTDR